MAQSDDIPVFTLFGETGHFPDVVHSERISARAAARGWHIAAHRHAQMVQLLLIQEGEVRAKLDQDEINLRSADFLFVPNQIVHEFHFAPDTVGQVLSFPLSVVKTIGPMPQDVLTALGTPTVGRIDDALKQLANLLAQTCESTGPFRAQRAVGLAHSVLGLVAEHAMLQRPSEPARASQRLAGLDRLIAQHMADGWSASDYAAALSLSTGHLSRLCRSAKGMGATAYLEQTIMEEACRLLAFTQLPVSEIGYRLGFADPSYFSKRFRTARQQTPSDYRTRFIE